MTETLTGRPNGASSSNGRVAAVEERTDDELLSWSRSDDASADAFGELYKRYAVPARRLAQRLLRDREEADDVVNDAFVGVLSAISNGAGPTTNFRHYIMATVRNGCRFRRGGPLVVPDQHAIERTQVPDHANRVIEAGVVGAAFSSLSPLWQRALWLTAVEGRSTTEVAHQLGRRPTAVASLTKRAREAFAEAYLTEHRTRPASVECLRIGPKLARYVRHRIGPKERANVESHLGHCPSCRRAVAELRDVNASLRSLAGAGWLIEGMACGVGPAAVSTAGLAAAGSARYFHALAAIASKALLAGSVVVPVVVVAAATLSSSTPRLRPSPVVVTPAAQVPSPGAAANVASLEEASVLGAPGAGPPIPSTVPLTIPPDDTVPPGTIPPMTVPPNTLPPITIPSIGVPPLSVPALSTPVVTIGPIVVSSVSTPSVTVPDVTTPEVPTVTTTALAVPPITIPTADLPPVTTVLPQDPQITLPVGP